MSSDISTIVDGNVSNSAEVFVDATEFGQGATPFEDVVEEPSSQRRRLVGRAARRRRRKFKQICALENVLFVQERRKSGEQHEAVSKKSPTVDVMSNVVPDVLPIDRDRIWPAVVELRRRISSNNASESSSSRITWMKSDEVALISQLGYVPGNAIKVACRMKDLISNMDPTVMTTVTLFRQCQTNHGDDTSPVVVQLYPIVYRNPHAGGKSGGKQFKLRKRQKTITPNDNGDESSLVHQQQHVVETTTSLVDNCGTVEDSMVIEPFPTIYWLTHPLLRCVVSKLELEGYGIALERRLKDDTDALTLMERAHHAYGQERYNFLSESDRQLIQSYHWEKAFSINRGIAGISNKKAVKCLHAHLAHYLSNSTGSQYNIVGRWVWEEIQLRYATNYEHGSSLSATKKYSDDITTVIF